MTDDTPLLRLLEESLKGSAMTDGYLEQVQREREGLTADPRLMICTSSDPIDASKATKAPNWRRCVRSAYHDMAHADAFGNTWTDEEAAARKRGHTEQEQHVTDERNEASQATTEHPASSEQSHGLLGDATHRVPITMQCESHNAFNRRERCVYLADHILLTDSAHRDRHGITWNLTKDEEQRRQDYRAHLVRERTSVPPQAPTQPTNDRPAFVSGPFGQIGARMATPPLTPVGERLRDELEQAATARTERQSDAEFQQRMGYRGMADMHADHVRRASTLTHDEIVAVLDNLVSEQRMVFDCGITIDRLNRELANAKRTLELTRSEYAKLQEEKEKLDASPDTTWDVLQAQHSEVVDTNAALEDQITSLKHQVEVANAIAHNAESYARDLERIAVEEGELDTLWVQESSRMRRQIVVLESLTQIQSERISALLMLVDDDDEEEGTFALGEKLTALIARGNEAEAPPEHEHGPEYLAAGNTEAVRERLAEHLGVPVKDVYVASNPDDVGHIVDDLTARINEVVEALQRRHRETDGERSRLKVEPDPTGPVPNEALPWQLEMLQIHRAAHPEENLRSVEQRDTALIGLVASVGSISNVVAKQRQRPYRVGTSQRDLIIHPEQLADVRIYLELLAYSMEIDLDAECRRRMPIIRELFPPCGTER